METTEIENLSKRTFQGGTFEEWFPQWKEFPDDWWGRIAFLCAPDSIRTVLAIVLICAWFHFCNVEPVKCEEEEDMRYLANMERRLLLAYGRRRWSIFSLLDILLPPPPMPPNIEQLVTILKEAQREPDSIFDSMSPERAPPPDGTLVWRKGPLQEEERKMTLVLDLDETLVHALEIPDHVDPLYLEEYIAQKNGGTYVPADLRIVISNRRNSLDCDGSNGDIATDRTSSSFTWLRSRRRQRRDEYITQPSTPPQQKGFKEASFSANASASDPFRTPVVPPPSPLQPASRPSTCGGEDKIIYVWKRPYLRLFLREAAKLFEIVIFTAGKKQYANKVIDQIDVDGVVRRRFYRDSCIERPFSGPNAASPHRQKDYLKDISQPGIVRPEHYPERAILIDNNPACYETVEESMDNAIPIDSFRGTNPDDKKLLSLLTFLNIIHVVNDVRAILQFRGKNPDRETTEMFSKLGYSGYPPGLEYGHFHGKKKRR